jgi:hypothetical protein
MFGGMGMPFGFPFMRPAVEIVRPGGVEVVRPGWGTGYGLAGIYGGVRPLSLKSSNGLQDDSTNGNGNPLPNTCSIGVSQPIYEGEVITEQFCLCPDGSYGYTCQEGFGNPCATNPDQQFFNAAASLASNYFVHCSNQIPYLKKCPAPLVWDQTLTTCNWPASYASAVPAYGGNSYNTPSAPVYSQPAAPAAPVYSQPAAPAYSQPAAPAAPVYSQPAAPAYSQPAAPSYSQPAAAPSYSQSYGGSRSSLMGKREASAIDTIEANLESD